MGEKDLNKFMELEKQLDNLIKNPSGTSRELMKKKDAIRSKMKKLEPGVRGMEDGGDVPKPKMRPESFKADKTESLDKEFSKKDSRINKKNMENVKGNLNKLKGSKESLEDNEDIFKKKVKKMQGGGEPVPPKFKGFSKLPEEVQEKINPKLATKFEFGGDVKGKKGRMMCRDMGITRKNKGFKIT